MKVFVCHIITLPSRALAIFSSFFDPFRYTCLLRRYRLNPPSRYASGVTRSLFEVEVRRYCTKKLPLFHPSLRSPFIHILNSVVLSPTFQNPHLLAHISHIVIDHLHARLHHSNILIFRPLTLRPTKGLSMSHGVNQDDEAPDDDATEACNSSDDDSGSFGQRGQTLATVLPRAPTRPSTKSLTSS